MALNGTLSNFITNCLVEVDQSLKLAHKPYAAEQEFDGYVWANTKKEQPVKEDDHGMDNIRYMVAYVDDDSQRYASGKL